MTILYSNNNVGIGQSSPRSLLEVLKTTSNTSLGVPSNASLLLSQGGNVNELSQILFGYTLNTSPAAIAYITTNAAGYTNGAITFATRDVTTDTAPTERMRITSGGAVQINTTLGAATLNMKSVSSGALIKCINAANGDGTIFAYGTSTSLDYAFNTYSVGNAFVISNNGNCAVSGALSKGSGSFRIDHPLESLSETHQLVHSFIEGPQADLIYRGKLSLVNGKAQANIDEVSTMTNGTFEALCREVQCFTTNESGWDLVKGKVIDNIIYIESQNLNSTDEISWMVIGERKDKHIMDTEWTDDNGKVIVEPLKAIEPIVPSEPTI